MIPANPLSFMDISERDKKLLATDDMVPMSWEESKEIAKKGDLTLFRRSPTQLADYLKAKQYFVDTCGDVGTFILRNKLKWEGNTEGAASFLESRHDVQILVNDYPYYFEDGIDHLVVWSKVRCECDATTEQPTPAATAKIEQFLKDTFDPIDISGDNIMWFKNTVSLQSVPMLEHFHVLVRKKGWEKIIGTAGSLDEKS